MIGNGVCDSACMNLACSFDQGDCDNQECAPGCKVSQIKDSTCQLACYTESCNYDGDDCKSAGKCSIRCLGLKGNHLCDEECNIQECDWDGRECLCASECTPDMLRGAPSSCDVSNKCFTEECKWHDGKCNYCSATCPKSKVGNGVCDPECQSEPCRYDEADCNSCSPGCIDQLKSTCEKSCLTLNCKYSATCSDASRITLARYTQSILSDWDYIDSYQDCKATGCDVKKLISRPTECHKECDNSACAYSLGKCFKGSCYEACSVCYQSLNGECLECNDGNVQFYGYCIVPSNPNKSSCPAGYAETIVSGKKICKQDDNSSKQAPSTFYLVKNKNSVTGVYTNLHEDFEKLLIDVNYNYNQILIGKGKHDLKQLTPNRTPVYVSAWSSPMNKPFIDIKEVIIKPWICRDGESVNAPCFTSTPSTDSYPTIQYKEIVVLDVMKNSKLIIEKINFTSKISLVPVCDPTTNRYCYYCPTVVKFGNKIYDQHSEEAPDVGQLCSNYHIYNLIDIHENGSLVLESVNFEDIRFEPRSIINAIGKASIEMKNVSFKNIRVKDGGTGVIYLNGCNDRPYYCSSLSYESGSVSLLNNGYELQLNQRFSGFLYGENVYSLTITGVRFEYNIVYSDNPLMNIKDYRSIKIIDCIFEYNLLAEGILKIKIQSSLDTSQISDNKIQDHEINHLKLKDLTISNNFSSKSLLFNIDFEQNIHNIKVSDLFISNNIANRLIKLEVKDLSNLDKLGGSRKAKFGNSYYRYYTSAKSLEIRDLEIRDCNLGDGGIISSKNYPNISIARVSMDNTNVSGSFNNDSQVGNGFRLNQESYVIDNFDILDPNIANLANISGVYRFEMQESTISNVKGNKTAMLVKADNLNTGSLSIENCSFTHLSASIENEATALSLEMNFQATLQNLVFTNNSNINSLGYGPLYLQGTKSAIFFISSCSFVSNTSGSAGGIYIKGSSQTTITSIKFHYNKADNKSGGALVFAVELLVSSSLTVSDCEFIGNSAAVYGGAISLDNSACTISGTDLKIMDSKFQKNTADIGGVFYMPEEVILSENSNVKNCIFQENKSDIGMGFLYFNKGVLLFDTCRFVKNTARGISMFNIVTSEDSKEIPTSVKFKDCIFDSNSGKYLNYISDSRQSSVYTENCEFMNNKGVVFDIQSGYLYDSESRIYKNENVEAPAFKLENHSNVALTHTDIYSNSASKKAGAIMLSQKSKFICNRCNIRDNNAKNNGGAIYVEQDSSIHLSSCNIYGNSSGGSGSAIYFIGADEESEILNSLIYENNAQIQGTISMYGARLSIKSSKIYKNLSKGSPGIVLNESSISLEDVIIHDHNSNSAAFIYAPLRSNLIIKSSKFFDSSSLSSVGGFYLGSSTASITNSEFYNIEGDSEGLFFIYDRSMLEISSSKAYNITGKLNAGMIFGEVSDIYIRDTEVWNIRNSVVNGMLLENLKISNSTVLECVSYDRSIINCAGCNKLEIEHSKFIKNQGIYGGALNLGGFGPKPKKYIIRNSSFEDNIAISGGGVYVEIGDLKISSCRFERNSALKSDTIEDDGLGGALLLNCNDNTCSFMIENTSFIDNYAEYEGGAIKWKNIKPVENENLFSGNVAYYGNDRASYAYNLTYETVSKNRKLEDMIEIASGQLLPYAVIFYIKDELGQVVKTDNISTCEIEVISNDVGSYAAGTTKVQAVEGVYTFDSFKIYATPLSTLTFKAKSSALGFEEGIESNVELDIEMSVRDCIEGEEKKSNACEVCEKGTFNVVPGERCEECLDNAVCFGGSVVVPEPGYWRSGRFSDKIFKCPLMNACLGGVDTNNTTGVCDKGYKGNLCQSCDENFSRKNENECSKCPDMNSNIGILVAILVAFIGIIGIMIRSSIQSAFKPKSIFSVYLKILTNYLQLVSIMSTFNLNWPSMVISLFDVQNQAANSTDQVFSVDCFVDSYYEPVFIKLTILALLPFLIGIILILVWSFILCISKLKKKSVDLIGSKFVGSLTVSFFFIHPRVLKSMFSIFNCMEIEDGEYWLISNLDVRCWEGNHLLFSITVGLPGLIIWGILAPALCLVFLAKKRNDLDELYLKLRFGFLYHGFKPKTFYWEFIILYRKVLFITISVFLTNYSIVIQAQTVFLILSIYLIVQHKFQPYSTDDLNSLEIYSILVSSATIYAGLYYLSGDLTAEFDIILFIIMILFNLVFMQLWIRKTLSMMMKMVVLKFPKIGEKLKNTFMRKFIVIPIKIEGNEAPNLDITIEGVESKINISKEYKDELIDLCKSDVPATKGELREKVRLPIKITAQHSVLTIDQMFSRLKPPRKFSYNTVTSPNEEN